MVVGYRATLYFFGKEYQTIPLSFRTDNYDTAKIYQVMAERLGKVFLTESYLEDPVHF